MPKTYLKRIAKFADVSVYAQIIDSRASRFVVIRSRRTIADYGSRDAAMAAARRLADGEIAEKHTDTLILERAASLRSSEALEGGLDARLLSALEIQRLQRETTSKARIDVARLVGNLAAEAGEIPTTPAELEDWIARALARVTARGNRDVHSRSGLTVRLQTFVRVMRQIESMPVVFRRWLHVAPLVSARVDAYKRGLRKEFAPETSYAPFAKSEIISLLASTKSFAESLSILVYLTGAFRAGEAERLTARHVTPDGLVDLPALVSKVSVKRQPPASILLRAAVQWFATHSDEHIAVPVEVERKRFRPTTAVHLLLARQTQLEVMERLGHGTLAMITNHYAKMIPLEFATARNATHYFGAAEIKLDGVTVPENMWDGFLLTQAIAQANLFSVNDFRPVVKSLVVVSDDSLEAPVVNL